MPAVVPDDCHNYGLILEQDMMSNGFLDELLPSSDEDENGSDVFNGCELTANAANFVITPLEYLDGRAADVRGTANPSLMSKPYWKAMIIEDMGAWWPRYSYDKQLRNCGLEPEQGEPIWCFKRWGGTRTRLPDGRIVYIGGEYGNYRDIDFYVYNDVIVVGPLQSIEHSPPINARFNYQLWTPESTPPPTELTPDMIQIYGYPTTTFPPTDFHTATYVSDPIEKRHCILIIGGLGHHDASSRVRTDVYLLDLGTFSIRRLPTSGWPRKKGANGHKVKLVKSEDDRPISLQLTTKEGDTFTLQLKDMSWVQ